MPHTVGFCNTLEEVKMNLKMDTRDVNGVTIVSCHGRVMFGEEATALRDNLKQILSLHQKIVLNLSEVSYIDSGG
jgi:anti-sigma B factor antagonist